MRTRVSSQERRPGAVVIGGDYQGLGIVRSLGRRGIPTCVIDNERSIARFSRYATHAVVAPDLRDELRTVECVLDAGRRLNLDGWVLYPTRDETVAAFSRHREQLRERFRVPTPDWTTIRVAWDKRETYRVASELGIPVPRTWCPGKREDLETIAMESSVAIKPAIKEHFIYATKAKAWKADTRDELNRLYGEATEILDAGEILIQDVIPGDGSSQFAYCAFVKDGEPVATMTVQRTRQHPPEFGRSSTFVQTVDVPELSSYAARFLRAIDYYGLVEIEFKHDRRDGHYKLLDVNARTWGYHTLGGAAGVDFAHVLYADQTGSRVSPGRTSSGIKWVRLATDLPTAALELGRGRLDWKTYVQSLRRFDVESVFCKRDPIPGLVELALIPYLAAKRGF